MLVPWYWAPDQRENAVLSTEVSAASFASVVPPVWVPAE